jgi:hypothetical protein
MTTQEANGSTAVKAPVSAVAILADLILMQSRMGLPEPHSVHLFGSNLCAEFDVADFDQVHAWHAAFSVEDWHLSTSRFTDRGPIHSTYTDRLGWRVRVTAAMPSESEVVPLPAATLDQLARVASPADMWMPATHPLAVTR